MTTEEIQNINSFRYKKEKNRSIYQRKIKDVAKQLHISSTTTFHFPKNYYICTKADTFDIANLNFNVFWIIT